MLILGSDFLSHTLGLPYFRVQGVYPWVYLKHFCLILNSKYATIIYVSYGILP